MTQNVNLMQGGTIAVSGAVLSGRGRAAFQRLDSVAFLARHADAVEIEDSRKGNQHGKSHDRVLDVAGRLCGRATR